MFNRNLRRSLQKQDSVQDFEIHAWDSLGSLPLMPLCSCLNQSQPKSQCSANDRTATTELLPCGLIKQIHHFLSHADCRLGELKTRVWLWLAHSFFLISCSSLSSAFTAASSSLTVLWVAGSNSNCAIRVLLSSTQLHQFLMLAVQGVE